MAIVADVRLGADEAAEAVDDDDAAADDDAEFVTSLTLVVSPTLTWIAAAASSPVCLFVLFVI